MYAGTVEGSWLKREAPVGDVCKGKPCWKGLGVPPLSSGAQYSDREYTPDGISIVLLSATPPRPTRIALRARGSLLGLPALGSLDLPVPVQLQRTGAACWESTFDTHPVSTSEMFKAVK